MPLVPLALPPGVYRNGTDLQSAGRWRDASLVRWTEGTMQPVGGWVRRGEFDEDKAFRSVIAWRDLSGDRWIAAGHANGLIVSNAAGTVTNITPAGLATGLVDAGINSSYGGGFYGMSDYGIALMDTGVYVEATTWSLDTWGQNLVACSSADGRLVEWSLNTAADAVAITGAPTGCRGLVVSAERFLFALGASGNYRRVQWSDREDNTTWTASDTNEAGDIDLQTAGQIMLGIRTRGQLLILTDLDAHTATYQGPPFVYGFERVGASCGAISRCCAAAIDQGVIWMGTHGFFRYQGGAVQEVPCDVSDFVFSGMNATQASKVSAMVNSAFSEIWWMYPGEGSTENDRYVVYNYTENHWAIGAIDRTCGIDRGVFSAPIMFATNGVAYDHESGTNRRDNIAYAESGPVQIGAGDQVAVATMMIPDEGTQGEVSATFKTRFHPNDVERSYGPYAMANPTDVRFTGRQVAMRVQGVVNGDWRVGTMRLDVKAGGLR